MFRRRKKYVEPPKPLTDWEFNVLAQYNGQRAQGILHSPAFVAQMHPLQEKYNQWLFDCIEARNRFVLGDKEYERIFGKKEDG